MKKLRTNITLEQAYTIQQYIESTIYNLKDYRFYDLFDVGMLTEAHKALDEINIIVKDLEHQCEH